MRSLLALCVMLGALLWSPQCGAQASLKLAPEAGEAPARLVLNRGVYEATFVLSNSGDAAASVRVDVPRGEPSQPRVPPSVTATFERGETELRIRPGQSKRVLVRWSPGRTPRVRQVFGVVIAKAEGQKVSSGFQAHALGAAGRMKLVAPTLLWLIPLLCVVLVGLFRRKSVRHMSGVVAGAAVAQALLAGWLLARLNPAVSAADANIGQQFIARVPISDAVEYAVGVDAVGLLVVGSSAAALFIAAMVNPPVTRRPAVFWSLVLSAHAALTLTLVALDLAVMLTAWVVAVLGFVALVSLAARSDGRRLARGAALALGSACVLLLFSLVHMAEAVDGFTASGIPLSQSFSLLEIGQVQFLAQPNVAGQAAPAVLFAMLLGAVALLAGIPPFHGWQSHLLSRNSAAVQVLAVVGIGNAALVMLVKLGCGFLPRGVAWASPALAGWGAAVVAYSAYVALVRRDLGRRLGALLGAQSGAVLLGVGGMTSIGLHAAVTSLVVRAIGGGLLLGCLGVVWARAETQDSRLLTGLGSQLPVVRRFALLAIACVIGVPGTIGFFSLLNMLTGTVPRHPEVALVASLAWAALALTASRLWAAWFNGEVAEQWRTSAVLEPFGGRFPCANARERLAFVVLGALIIGLGFFPQLVASRMDARVWDYAERLTPAGPSHISRVDVR